MPNASNETVNVYDAAGTLQTTFSGAGSQPGELKDPFGVASDAAGNIYVADASNNRIQVFDSAYDVINIIGSFTGAYGYANGQLYHPMDMDVDGAGSVYLVDQYNNRIQIFDAP